MRSAIANGLVMVPVCLMAACGGGGGNGNQAVNPGIDNNPGSGIPVSQTGVFVDSAVANIGYRTATKQGFTNAAGEFEYVAGETVVFFIGALEFPPVLATGTVTPADIADTDDLSHPVVINIARLLQSVDVDGDASNGIQISNAAALTAGAADLTLPVADFAALPNVVNLVANSGSVTTSLINADAAIAHLADTLDVPNPLLPTPTGPSLSALIGSWVAGTPGGENVAVITFLDSSHYMIANDEDDSDDAGQDGMEYGTYTWNPDTGAFTASALVDTNGEWGMSHPCGQVTVSVNSNTLTYMESGGSCTAENNVAGEFARATSQSNALVGGWVAGEADELVVITMIDDLHFMLSEEGESDSDGHRGIEHGTYSIDAATNAITFNIITDTNGEWGVSHPCPGMGAGVLACGPSGANGAETFTIDGDTMTFTPVSEDPVPFERIGS